MTDYRTLPEVKQEMILALFSRSIKTNLIESFHPSEYGAVLNTIEALSDKGVNFQRKIPLSVFYQKAEKLCKYLISLKKGCVKISRLFVRNERLECNRDLANIKDLICDIETRIDSLE